MLLYLDKVLISGQSVGTNNPSSLPAQGTVTTIWSTVGSLFRGNGQSVFYIILIITTVLNQRKERNIFCSYSLLVAGPSNQYLFTF